MFQENRSGKKKQKQKKWYFCPNFVLNLHQNTQPRHRGLRCTYYLITFSFKLQLKPHFSWLFKFLLLLSISLCPKFWVKWNHFFPPYFPDEKRFIDPGPFYAVSHLWMHWHIISYHVFDLHSQNMYPIVVLLFFNQ